MQSNNPIFNRSAEFKGRGGSWTTGGSATQTPQDSPSAQTLEEMYQAPPATPVDTGRMTYDDVVVKTGITFGVLLAGAVVGWQVPGLAMIGLIVGLVLGLVNAFKKSPSPALILLYAGFEGLFVGGISYMFENMSFTTDANGNPVYMNGIVAQAVLATLSVFLVSLFLYRSGKVRVTPKFRRGAMIAMGGYLVFAIFNFLAQMLNIGGADAHMFGFRHGWFGIAIGLFAVGLAAVMLILDFDFIQKGVEQGIPQKYAWTAAFALTVTMVWLYIEMLRLIAILRGE
jgi:uncharacterized YccA/Bax inhibitor family protein